MSEAAPWRYLVEQAERCLAAGDPTGAEVHLVAALERARGDGDRVRVAEALVRLGELRIAQRRELAAERLLKEARALLEEMGEGDAEGRARVEALLRRVGG